MKPKHFFNQLQHDQIVEAIRKAELKTSGEIRVFITRHDPPDALAAAQAQFTRLGMEKTTERNAVLLYVAPRAHKFAVIGDSGVHAKCGDEFWTRVTAEMSAHFKQGGFSDGLLHGISQAGELLAQHFPRQAGGKNQLSDDVAED